ncbi:MAG: Chromosome-partitioning protein Spo0J [Planctomycetes bacterium ADurb.Bin126]|nr:MAG: Chromosome-partitioning protein Spo0J [Planctomycetes bacterium ADurb.Bin126]
MKDSVGIDVPVTRLRPLRDRKVTKREYDRIVASIKAVGLIEPLVIYPDADGYVILDGAQCYRAMVELGVEVVPCILGRQREAFTGNRMVNRVSPVQEHRMIEKSLGEVDEATIAAALGISGLGHRLKKTLLKQLHPDVAAAFDAGKISRASAREFTHVKPQRQKEIIRAMESYKDYSTTFVRTLVIKTPSHQRENRGRKHNPWDKTTQKKNDLLKKLAEAEQKHDFYSQLYRQYTVDLLRLAIYARSLLTNQRLREYLDRHHPDIVERFESIIANVRG